jgi:hypothetical protein
MFYFNKNDSSLSKLFPINSVNLYSKGVFWITYEKVAYCFWKLKGQHTIENNSGLIFPTHFSTQRDALGYRIKGLRPKV